MKITVLLFCSSILISTNMLLAQPVITSSVMGEIGDVVSYSSVDVTGFDPGASGADVIWNFSDISVTGSYPGGSYVDAASTPYAADFPGANTAATDGVSYEYFKITSSEYTLYGAYKGGILIYYDDPEEIFTFPLTYGTSNSDDLHSDFFSGTDFERSGDVTMTADGYGTLILPSGTYSNILRVKFEETYSDMPVGIPYPIDYDFTTYFWLAEGLKGPLFEYFNDITTLAGTPTTIEVAFVNNETPEVAIKTIDKTSARIFPNPASSVITVTLPQDMHADNISVYDITGNEMPVFFANDGSLNNVVDISGLPSGIYTLKITCGNNILTSTISKV